MKKIVAFHLYNDFSGSPKVLKTILDGLLSEGYQVDLITSEGGALDELCGRSGFRRIVCKYSFSNNQIITIFWFIIAQIKLFCISLRYILSKDIVFYINTIMPVGAAVAAKLMQKEIIYHYHENASAKGFFYQSLAYIMQKIANRIICVSEYQRSFLKRNYGIFVVPNALPKEFTEKIVVDIDKAFECRTVLMLSSLKIYKGTLEFIQLAQMNPSITFKLVINETEEIIKTFYEKYSVVLPDNLIWYSRQKDVTSFYNSAAMTLNLTDKNYAIETFGLTALESLTAGMPVIVPSVGGISEFIIDAYNGYKKDVQNLNDISELINLILSDKELYTNLANNALATASEYSVDNVLRQVKLILNNNRNND